MAKGSPGKRTTGLPAPSAPAGARFEPATLSSGSTSPEDRFGIRRVFGRFTYDSSRPSATPHTGFRGSNPHRNPHTSQHSEDRPVRRLRGPTSRRARSSEGPPAPFCLYLPLWWKSPNPLSDGRLVALAKMPQISAPISRASTPDFLLDAANGPNLTCPSRAYGVRLIHEDSAQECRIAAFLTSLRTGVARYRSLIGPSGRRMSRLRGTAVGRSRSQARLRDETSHL